MKVTSDLPCPKMFAKAEDDSTERNTPRSESIHPLQMVWVPYFQRRACREAGPEKLLNQRILKEGCRSGAGQSDECPGCNSRSCRTGHLCPSGQLGSISGGTIGDLACRPKDQKITEKKTFCEANLKLQNLQNNSFH